MKRFLKTVSIYALIILFIIIVMNHICRKEDTEGVNKFKKIPSDILICNFGSSHGQNDFNYSDLKDIPCFNFGMGSQTLSYDLRLFEYYKSSIKKGAVVFIPVSYFSFFGEEETLTDTFLKKNRRYYLILPKEMIKQYDLRTAVYLKYFPSLVDAEELVKDLVKKVSGTINGQDAERSALTIDVEDVAKDAAFRHVTSKFNADGSKNINEEEIDALKKMIISCFDSGFTPVLITTPYLREYTDAVKKADEHLFDDFYGIINRITEETDVEYYDYAFDHRFTDNYPVFYDSDHLNEEGARMFVNILLEETTARKFLSEP